MLPGIPYDQKDGWIWLDGKFCKWQDAKIHVLNHGLHYSSSVFEGIRVYNGKIFKLTEHNQRLINSGKIVGIELEETLEELNYTTEELIKKNNLKNAYIRTLAYHGSETLRVSSYGCTTKLMIAAWEYNTYFNDKKSAISLLLSKYKRPHPETMPVHAKTASMYMIGNMAKTAAIKNNYDDALILDYRGFIADSSSSNIFFVKDDVFYTPIADCFLEGITRNIVIDILESLKIPVKIGHFQLQDIFNADACFLTGTAVGIEYIDKINNIVYQRHKLIDNLKDQYNSLTSIEYAL